MLVNFLVCIYFTVTLLILTSVNFLTYLSPENISWNLLSFKRYLSSCVLYSVEVSSCSIQALSLSQWQLTTTTKEGINTSIRRRRIADYILLVIVCLRECWNDGACNWEPQSSCQGQNLKVELCKGLFSETPCMWLSLVALRYYFSDLDVLM